MTHLWDEDKVSGRFFATEYEHRSNWTQWDAYYLFDHDAQWSEASRKLLGSGRTVIGHSDDLKREIAPFLIAEAGSERSMAVHPATSGRRLI